MGISRYGARALAGSLTLSLLVSVTGVEVAYAATVPGFATLTGTLPAFSSSGPVTVEVLAQGSLTHLAVGQTVPFTTVVAPVSVQGSAFSVAVPDSAAIQALAARGNGNVNLMAVVQNGSQMSTVFTPARAGGTAAPAGTADAAAAAQSPIRLSSFPAPWKIGGASASPAAAAQAPAVPLTCEPPVVVATRNNQRTRIGELHVAAESWMEAIYEYNTNADSTVQVGSSTNGTNWAVSGSIGVSNSIGSGGTLPHTGGWVGYVNDTMDFDEYNYCGVLYVQAVDSHGDTYDGTNTPGFNPYGTCHNAIASNGSWRIATVPHGDGVTRGSWNSDTSTVTTFSLMTSIWGFNFNGSTGYSVSDRTTWYNGSTNTNTYVCGGDSNIAKSPVLYNNPS